MGAHNPHAVDAEGAGSLGLVNTTPVDSVLQRHV